jgi:2-polyprenyl-3-methyl-5-hydroxy-6-metoxy-1,4-benzoquinol methylase
MTKPIVKMDNPITVFTKISSSYEYSSEFMLCLKMFKEALPPHSTFFCTKNNYPAALRDLIIKHVSDISTYVLIAKEPAVLMIKGTVEKMLNILKMNPAIFCVLPSDPGGLRSGKNPNYYTLRGFERFVDSLHDPEQQLMLYDGRDPWVFIIRGTALQQREIPEDPLIFPRLLPENTYIALNAYIHPFINYYEETRSDVLQFVPDNIKSLLDIGCARGNFGASIRGKIGCRVVGVELNPYEAQKAKGHLDHIIVGDILTTEIDEKFDCITCLDILEHVSDFDKFLLKINSLLHRNGYLLISIPNVGHWSIIEDLLAGRWDYAPAGILCISHLRFFTKKTIQSLLEGAGLKILLIEEQITHIPEHLEKSLCLLKINGIEVDEKSLSCLGYYILAQKII